MADDRRRERGSVLLLLLVLLVGLGGAGAWNYHRNLQEEEQVFRPYGGYSEDDLASLIAATEQEIEGLQARYLSRRGQRAVAKDTGFVGDQVREFERVQRASRATRDAGAALSEREASLQLLREEKQRRERDADKLQLFLRRLTTLPS